MIITQHDALNTLLEACSQPFVAAKITGEIILVNQALCELTGYTKEELLQMTWTELTPAEWWEKQAECIQELLGSLQPAKYKNEYIHKDGYRIPVELQLNIMTNIEGNSQYLYTFVTDITERKKLEELFEKAFHSNTNAMAITVWPEGKLVDVNQAWLNLFGFQKEQVIGLTTTDLGFWDDINEKQQLYQTIQEKKKLRNYEQTCRACDGSARTILISADFIEIDCKEHLIISMTDITHYKRLEREIARLDSLNLIGELSAGVAHEIRNPLTVVKGYLQYFGGKSSEYKEQFEALSNELAHVETIITDFLSLARTKTTMLTNRSLNSIIEEVSPFIMADALKKGVDIELNLGAISCFSLDDKELKQLILNLVRNAVEAVDGKGKVTIETRMEDGNVLLSVTDTGCGIPKELCDRIFDPFFTTKEKGTGLGLSICASIVERHGGTIQVQSDEGKGTSFLVHFALM